MCGRGIIFIMGKRRRPPDGAVRDLGDYFSERKIRPFPGGARRTGGGEAFEPLGTGDTKYYHLEEN